MPVPESQKELTELFKALGAEDPEGGKAAIQRALGNPTPDRLRVIGSDGTSLRANVDDGKVVKVMDFGAFVNFFGPRDGLVHISELAPKRVAKVTDVVKEGDTVKVKLLGFDDRGKVRLSMKVVDQATGKEIVPEKKDDKPADQPPSG